MYEWRRMTAEQRDEALARRRGFEFPWHNPPHQDWGEGTYLLSAACYEHRPFIGTTSQRMADCERQLLEGAGRFAEYTFAWCILPNHYHLLIHTAQIKPLIKAIGRVHGRLSYEWNGKDKARGRQVWHSCAERTMRSEGHFWATMNYVHHNPVHHGYCGKWQEWPFSSAASFLKKVGKEEAARTWKAHPLRDYGDGWDDSEM